MGVDMSINVEVGVVFDSKLFDEYMESAGEEDGEWEALYRLIEDEPLLEVGVGGSYYDTNPNYPWVSVKRLSSGGNSHDVDGGVYGVSRPVITLAEREALQRVAYKVGQPFTDASQFVSILWH